jgi:hypothetical protein
MAACSWCSNEMTTGASCTVAALHRLGVPYRLSKASRHCGDCGVAPGGLHHLGCDLQRCPVCRGQLFSCGCRFDEDLLEDEWDDVYDEVDERFESMVRTLLAETVDARVEGWER